MDSLLKTNDLFDAFIGQADSLIDLDGSDAIGRTSEAAGNSGIVLTSTLWNQNGTVYVLKDGTQTALDGFTYNQYCPNASGSDTTKTLTGCTNTADSQILYYWIEKKGFNPTLKVTAGNYFFLETDLEAKRYYISETANVGEGTLSVLNSALASSTKTGNGDFIAALNFYCGVNNHSIYGTGNGTSSGTTTYWYYGAFSDGTNAWAFKAAGFDSYYSVTRPGNAAASRVFFNSGGLTDVGYSVVRENLDYGEPIRVGIPGHAIYMDGYRYNSSSKQYEYHLNYGWGTNASSNTRWYSAEELTSSTNSGSLSAPLYLTYLIVDLSPDIKVNVTSARGDYYGGSFLRGIERINHIRNDKATTFSFDSGIAGKVIAMSTASVISSQVDVAFINVNAVLSTTAGSLLSSGRGMGFQLKTGSMAVNSKSASAVVNETGNSLVAMDLDDSYLYSGSYSGGAAGLDSLLRANAGHSYGELEDSFYRSIKGYAVKSGSANDIVKLANGSALYGGLNLGGGANVLNIESGSLFCGSFTGSANTLTANLTVNAPDYTGPMVVVRDNASASAFHSASGGVLNVTLTADALRPQVYNLVYGSSAALMKNFSVNLTAPGISRTLSYDNPNAGRFVLTFNEEKLGLMFSNENVKESKVNLYYGSYLIDSGVSMQNTTVGSGLLMTVLSGGTVTSSTVKASGTMDVYRDGTVKSITVDGGGVVNLHEGVFATGMKIAGTLKVTSGSSASDTAVSAGGKVLVEAGGELNGTLSIADGATVSVSKGGSVVMDIRGRAAGSGALIGNIGLISGTPTIALRMASYQPEGTYVLATGAAGLSSEITVRTDKRELGTMPINSSLRSGGFYCSLKQTQQEELAISIAHADDSVTISHEGSVGFDGIFKETLLLKTDYSGRYCFSGRFDGLNGSVTIYNGKKKIGSGRIRNGLLTFNKNRTILLDSAIQYSIVVKNSDRGKTASDFNYSLQGVSIFWKGTHDDDTPDGRAAIAVSAPGAELSSGWVGFSDAVDYQKFILNTAADLSFVVSANDFLKATIYDQNMKVVQRSSLKAYGLTFSVATRNRLFAAGTYYLKVESANASKGGGADYSVTVNASSRFFTKAGGNSGTIEQASKKAAVLPGETVSGWVGFSDAVDYIKLETAQNGVLTFDLDAETARAYAGRQVRIRCLDESGKNVKLVSDSFDSLMTRNAVSEGIYYLGVSCANVKKFDTSYQIATGFLAV